MEGRILLWSLTSIFSISSEGVQGDSHSPSPTENGPPAISDDGRYVAFSSDAANLVPGDTNGRADIFLHDRAAGTTTWISVPFGGGEANGDSTFPAMTILFSRGCPLYLSPDKSALVLD